MYTFSSVPSEGNSRRSYIRSGKSWNTTQRVNTHEYANLVALQTCSVSVRRNNLVSIYFAVLYGFILPGLLRTIVDVLQSLYDNIVAIDVNIQRTSSSSTVHESGRSREGNVGFQSTLGTCGNSKVGNSGRSSRLCTLLDSQLSNTQCIHICIRDGMDSYEIVTVLFYRE